MQKRIKKKIENDTRKFNHPWYDGYIFLIQNNKTATVFSIIKNAVPFVTN